MLNLSSGSFPDFLFLRREETGSERRASVRESIRDITGNGRTEHNAHVARQSQDGVLRSGSFLALYE